MSRTKTCPRCGEIYDETVAFCAIDGARLVRGTTSVDLIGTVIAERYRIVSRIGEGGMGQVFLGEHVRMKRKSAIKIMRAALVGDVEALQRFTREAENASQLSHPNIAAIFDFGETPDGLVYLAMEYVDGVSLAGKLQDSFALHPDVAADILGQAADALQAAHDMNMLHRDVKPDNIMLGKRADGTFMVKLVDFGIARTMDGSDQKVTRTGFAVGTPQYMSPEQLSGDVLDARSDQYSLALVAFFALTGKQAFPAESSKESLIARLTSRPQTLLNAKQDVHWPEGLQDVFDRALAPEPADRFVSVSAFAHALSGAISSMTPTQTAELYRRALDVRVSNVAARTPHGDLEALRSNSGSLAAVGTPSSSRAVPVHSSTSASIGTSTSASGVSATLTAATGTYTSPGSGTSGAAVIGKRARWPFVIGGVVTVTAALTLFLAQRERAGRATTDSVRAPVASLADSAKPVAVTASPTPPPTPPVGVVVPPAAPIVNVPAAKSEKTGKPAVADSAARVSLRDSLRRDSIRREPIRRAQKAAADTAARASNARARYPEAAERAALARGIDAKARIVKNGDVRATFMPTPVFVWRAQQLRAWKEANTKLDGTPFDAVDPIERWSAWTTLVSSHRAVYVLEVTAEKTPWPSFAPEKIFDFKRGDVTAVEVMRDGVAVPLDAISRLTAVVNGPEHLLAGKLVPNSIVATLPPTTFIPREDGSFPKIELLAHDATRNGAITKLTLSESLVRRLYEDFSPWRDALARP